MDSVLEQILDLAQETARSAPDRACRELLAAERRYPRQAKLLALLGHCERLCGDAAGAESHLREALALDPDLPQASSNLAHLLRNQGRYNAAAEVMLAVASRRIQPPRQLLQFVEFLRQCARSDLALRLCEAQQAAAHADPGLRFAYADLLLTHGRFAAAAEALRAVLSLAPLHPGALLRLAQTARCQRRDDPDLARLEAALAAAGPTHVDSAVAASFALGKLHDDLGDYAAAAPHFERGNRLQDERSGWDARAASERLRARIAAGVAPRAAVKANAAPLFVVGMPRSGTTLIANALARHPAIVNRGELNWLATLASDWREAGRRPSDAATLAEVYLAHLIRDDNASARYYLDKNPLNFTELDAIAAFFAEARIVHCRRAPRDLALSIYGQFFAHPDNGYAYSIANIARYHADYSELMKTWPARLGLDPIEIEYESFVADPDGELARTWRALGLDPAAARGPQAEAPAETVRTASVWQARQAIGSGSVGRWRAYAELIPGLDAIGAASND